MLKSNVIDIISEQGEKKEKVSRSGESLKSFETKNENTRVKEAAAAQLDHYDDHHPTIEISSDDDEEDDEKEEVEGDAKLFEEEGAQKEVVDFWEVRLLPDHFMMYSVSKSPTPQKVLNPKKTLLES